MGRREFLGAALMGAGAAMLGGCSLNGVIPGSNPIVMPGLSDAPASSQEAQESAARVLEGGTLVCQTAPLSTIDPHVAHGYWERLACRCLFDSLTEYDFNQMTLVGKAATSWEAESDSRRFTFHVREGMTFHNGSAVTSSCFAYAWGALVASSDIDERQAACLSMVSGYEDVREGKAGAQLDLECPDDYTLIVNLSRPFPDFAYMASMTQLAPLPVPAPQPGAAMPKDGSQSGEAADAGLTVVGNGPFAVDAASGGFDDGGVLHLVRNASYWDTNAHIDALTFSPTDDFADACDTVATGNLDVVHVPIDCVTSLADELGSAGPSRVLNPGEQVASEDFSAVCMLVCNCAEGPLASASARQALANVIDQESLALALGLAPSCVADNVFMPTNLGYEEGAWTSVAGDGSRGSDSDEGNPTSQDSASLLSAAFDSEFPELEILCDPCLLVGLGELVVAQLADAGVAATLVTPAWDVFSDRLANADFDAALICHLPLCDTAGIELFNLFHSQGVDNVGGYASDDIDAALEQAGEESDEARRLDALRTLCAQIALDMPVVPLLYSAGAIASSARVNNLPVSASYMPDFGDCWLSA